MSRKSTGQFIYAVEQLLGYEFANKQLLLEALTHKSYYHENREGVSQHNERLEFLGDSVIGLVVVEYLFLHKSSYAESVLAKIKSYIVLTEVSHDLFGKTVLMSGAFGPVGPKLISSMLKRGCKRVVVLDNYASQLSALLEKASMDSGKENIIPVLGGWNWEQQAEQAFRDYAPQIVLQTATRKYLLPHVPPDLEFIQRSNFSRSFKLAQLAMANQAEIFCIISSHEAGNGNNPISSSLKQMEDELIARFSGSEKTKLAIVRVEPPTTPK